MSDQNLDNESVENLDSLKAETEKLCNEVVVSGSGAVVPHKSSFKQRREDKKNEKERKRQEEIERQEMLRNQKLEAKQAKKQARKDRRANRRKRIKEFFITLLIIWLVITVLSIGLYIWNHRPYAACKALMAQENYSMEEAFALYEKILMEQEKAEMKEVFLEELTDRYKDYQNDTITESDFSEILKNYEEHGFSEEEVYLNISQKVEVVQQSRSAFETALGYMKASNYEEAVKEFEKVDPEDISHAGMAVEHIENCKNLFRDSVLKKVDDLLQVENYEAAVTEINQAMTFLVNDEILTEKLNGIHNTIDEKNKEEARILEEQQKEEWAKQVIEQRLTSAAAMLQKQGELPNGHKMKCDSEKLGENLYAIVDIDKDDTLELVFKGIANDLEDQKAYIFEYDQEYQCFIEQYSGSAQSDFYNNGYIIDNGLSDNEYGEDAPITIYHYSEDVDKYEFICTITQWDKAKSKKGPNKQIFPTKNDTDQDGVIYIVEDQQKELSYIDLDVMESLVLEFIGNAIEEVDFKQLSYLKVSDVNDSFLKKVASMKSLALDEFEYDLGISYATGVSEEQIPFEEMEKRLTSDFKVELEKGTESSTASYQGKKVMVFHYLDLGSITYENLEIPDVRVFSLYPGLEKSQIAEKMQILGLEAYEEDSTESSSTDSLYYRTGSTGKNVVIVIQLKNDKINKITVDTKMFRM